MYSHTCGDSGQHWYGKDEECACGQVPNRLLAAMSCDCESNKRESKEHTRDCWAVLWAIERNEWIVANPGIDPPLPPVPERRVLGS